MLQGPSEEAHSQQTCVGHKDWLTVRDKAKGFLMSLGNAVRVILSKNKRHCADELRLLLRCIGEGIVALAI